jgi:hypothetical protein
MLSELPLVFGGLEHIAVRALGPPGLLRLVHALVGRLGLAELQRESFAGCRSQAPTTDDPLSR